MALKPIYKIHPAIGIARLGNAPADTFFIGPEAPGRPITGDPAIGTMVPPFKDAGLVKPQAARFRIFEYVDDGKGKYKVGREINLASEDVQSITWTVHLANKKAAFFAFKGLRGNRDPGPSAVPVRRNAGVTDRKTLWLDPGPRPIGGVNQKGVEFRRGTAPKNAREQWPAPAPDPPIEFLGELRTDAAGRLIVIGGKGLSSGRKRADGTLVNDLDHPFNNDDWFDDASDGPVEAVIFFKKNPKKVEPLGSWVICGPPDFAPDVQNIVTLYDVLFDLAARKMKLPEKEPLPEPAQQRLRAIHQKFFVEKKTNLAGYRPSFDEEVWPILRRAIDVTMLFGPAQSAHAVMGASDLEGLWRHLADPQAPAAARRAIFERLRPPGLAGDGTATTPKQTMPMLLGDDPYPVSTTGGDGGWGFATELRLSLTRTQYSVMEQWSLGNFEAGSPKPPRPSTATPAVITPHGLDQAALESCVGGGLYPGIEVGWQIRHHELYLEPFRIKKGATSQYVGETGEKVAAGFFTRQMAVPWQADFLACSGGDRAGRHWGWWPAQRPDQVYVNENAASLREEMVNWHRSTITGGFVTPWPSASEEMDFDPSFQEMVDHWWYFAFIKRTGEVLFEDERAPKVPP